MKGDISLFSVTHQGLIKGKKISVSPCEDMGNIVDLLDAGIDAGGDEPAVVGRPADNKCDHDPNEHFDQLQKKFRLISTCQLAFFQIVLRFRKPVKPSVYPESLPRGSN
jgi:hypothetical protein